MTRHAPLRAENGRAPDTVAAAAWGAGDKREQTGEIVNAGQVPDKAAATAKAQAARVGCSLHGLAGGGWLLSHARWGMAKELPDLRGVYAMLERMGVPR